MSFKSENKKISGLLDKRIYVIPRNQRRYVWTEANWKDLMEDLEFSMNNTNRPHFMGSVVFEKSTDSERGDGVEMFSIIDGQQRITTFLLFLSTIMYLFKERSEQSSFEGLKSYLITTNLTNESYCKLTPERYPNLETFVRNVCDWENKFNTISKLIAESSSSTRINKDIFDAVRFFYDKLKPLNTVQIEKYRNALLASNVVEIIATSEEDAYTIFEILNARGQILEDYELIKNYIMRYYEPSNAVDAAKTLWERDIISTLGNKVSQFIKHYVTHRYSKSGNGHNFNYDVLKTEINKHQVKDLLNDLCKKASYYKIIIDPKAGEEGNCSDVEYNVYSFMRSNRGMLFRPMFLSLLHRYKTEEITKDLYENVLVFIKHFFICYNLLGRLTSNKLSDTVQNSSKNLEDGYSIEVLKQFVEGLERRLPTLNEFKRSFQSIGWSKNNEYYKDTSQKNRAQIALLTLEAIEKGSWDIGPYTIEHLNPDSGDIRNAGIGNLTLLESNSNGNAGSKDFSQKLDYYKESSFKITRNVYMRYHDSPSSFNPDTRAAKMAERIYKYMETQKNKLLNLL